MTDSNYDYTARELSVIVCVLCYADIVLYSGHTEYVKSKLCMLSLWAFINVGFLPLSTILVNLSVG